MNSSRYFILFAKSQTEGLNQSEKKEFEKLKIDNPDFVKGSEFLSDINLNIEIQMEADGTSVFNNIRDEINSNDIIQFESNSFQKTRAFSIQKIAATIVVFCAFAFLTYFFIQNPFSKSEDVIALNEVNIIEKAVTSGQKLKLYLPDGSIVWLNSDSKLKYPEKFATNERVVELEGEAFFMVDRNPQKPFIVRSGELNTTALGTSFNIKNYGSESLTRVTLVTGKVRVELNDNSIEGIVLDEGYAVNYSKSNKLIYKSQAKVDKVISWKDGILLFEDDSFETVINSLSRWYGVTFIIKNYDGREWTYSGKFKNEYLSNILESISFIENFDYTIENKKVILSFKN